MSSESRDPLVKASEKYWEVIEYAEVVAAAADYHPEIAFDQDASTVISNGDVNYEDEEEAMADIRANALMLSKAWEEAQNYIEGSFRDEFIGKQGGNTIDREKDEAYRKLQQQIRETEMELWNLDQALGHVLEHTPSSDQFKVRLESEKTDGDLPDKGDFF